MTEYSESEDVLFACAFLTESIVKERGLPSLNESGTNRATRLAEALLAAGSRVFLLSSATALRQKWTGTFFHPRRVISREQIPVLFAWSIGIPYLSSLFEPLAMICGTREICKNHRPAIVIVYDYYPATLLAGFVAKWFYGAKMILDVEDVCQPRLADWIGRGDQRPLFQLVGWFLLKLGLAGCDLVLVPSRKFLATAGISKPNIVVTGCIAVKEPKVQHEKLPSEPLLVLFSGKLDDEQGVGLVLNVAEELSKTIPSKRAIEFHLCGFSNDEAAFRERVSAATLKGASVFYHGTLARETYLALLMKANVCVSMQKPHGRHGNAKTPSKVYEYLAHGKVVITSDVGDFRELPSGVISLCDWSVNALMERLQSVANDWDRWKRMAEDAAEYAKEEFSLHSVGERILRSVSPKTN